MICRGVIAVALALAGWAAPAASARGDWETLTGCSLITNDWNDGDSFHVRRGGREYIFRLYFVDTPELHDVSAGGSRTAEQAAYWRVTQPVLSGLAERAAAFSREALRSGTFTVITRWEDAKGDSHLPRRFAIIQTRAGDLGEMLVANGLARIHGHHMDYPGGLDAARYQARLQALERRARSARLGGWAGSANAQPVPDPEPDDASMTTSDLPAF